MAPTSDDRSQPASRGRSGNACTTVSTGRQVDSDNGLCADRRTIQRRVVGMTEIRPMMLGDVVGVRRVVEAAGEELERRAGHEPQTRTDEQREYFLSGLRRFVERDPEGAWVAADGDSVVGMAACIRRASFWGLSMLFVDPARQNQGLGRQLLDAGLASASGAGVRMILSSSDPRALRRYSQAGLAATAGCALTSPARRWSLERQRRPHPVPVETDGAASIGVVASINVHAVKIPDRLGRYTCT